MGEEINSKCCCDKGPATHLDNHTMTGSFKDRFANKISVLGKDGCTTRVGGQQGQPVRQTQHSQQQQQQQPQPTKTRNATTRTKPAAQSSARQPAARGYSSRPAPQKEVEQPTRQPRAAVDYKPYTYTEYKTNCQPGKWEKLGTLGPDLQDEELLNKRAQKERLKDYSSQLRKYNAQVVDSENVFTPASQPTAQKPKSKREMAREYAARVPKPKLKPKKLEPEPFWDDEVEFAEAGPMSELAILESKHRQDQLAVEQIRQQLG